MATIIPKKKGPPVPEKLQNIKVMVRVRPLCKSEEDMHIKCIVKCASQRELVTKDKRFHFDRVFKPDTEQIEVYLAVVAPMIPDVVSGYNCTVFAYGPTGSGKTYTMTGHSCQSVDNWKTDPFAGCIPRAAAHIFEEINAIEKSETSVKVSYLELYNEEIRDLLSDDETVLPIFNDVKGSVFIQGLTEVSVYDSEGLCKQLQKGVIKRQTAPTLMNHQSSRSHTVFTISVHSRELTVTGEDILKSGKINLVDLAGSENIARSGCKDIRAVELANINKSLLTLGRVIQALADKAPKHVPYRDSKLTRILQDSLGGHTKTAIIATISPGANSHDETISTLDYASRARDIKNTPTVNEKLTKTQMIQGLITEIDRLQRDLDAARDKSGFYVNKDNYQRLIDSVELVTGEKLTMEELTKKQGARIKELEEMVSAKLKEFDDTIVECKRSKEQLYIAKAVIKEKKESLKQERYVSEAYEAKAGHLHKDVKQLITTTEILSEERGLLQDKLEKQYYINITNQSAARVAVNRVVEMLKRINEEEQKLKISDEHVSQLCRQDIGELKLAIEGILEQIKDVLDNFTQSSIQSLVINEDIKTTMNTYITTVETKAKDLSQRLTNYYDVLATFDALHLSRLVGDCQNATKEFLNSIREICRNISRLLDEDDDIIAKAFDSLEVEVRCRRHEEEELHRQRQKKDSEILDHIRNIKSLMNRKREARSSYFTKKMASAEKEAMDHLEKITDAFKKNTRTLLLHDIPLPSEPNDFTEAAITMETAIVKNITEIEAAQQSASTRIFAELGNTVAEKFSSIGTVLETKVNIVNSRLDFLMDDRETFEHCFENFTKKTNEILTEGFLQKVVPVSHDGDTPIRKPLVVPRPTDPQPRAVLIEKFKQERAAMGDEDKENIPQELNISSSPLTNFRMSDSDIDLGESAETSHDKSAESSRNKSAESSPNKSAGSRHNKSAASSPIKRAASSPIKSAASSPIKSAESRHNKSTKGSHNKPTKSSRQNR